MSKYTPLWSLDYIEPDVFLVKEKYNILVDAKYKSHLLNFDSILDSLKEEHRADLHQLLAYSSFSRNINKLSFLFYPNINVYYKELDYFSNASQINNKMILFGVPLSKSEIPEAQRTIKSIITEYESSVFQNS
jgi:5-methylcytosine-specific restriction endonuclease McrBC regulatory subunit McrC